MRTRYVLIVYTDDYIIDRKVFDNSEFESVYKYAIGQMATGFLQIGSTFYNRGNIKKFEIVEEK